MGTFFQHHIDFILAQKKRKFAVDNLIALKALYYTSDIDAAFNKLASQRP
jgi:hypothetical protein